MNLCIPNDTRNRVKGQPMEGKKIAANSVSGKELIFKLYKEFL